MTISLSTTNHSDIHSTQDLLADPESIKAVITECTLRQLEKSYQFIRENRGIRHITLGLPFESYGFTDDGGDECKSDFHIHTSTLEVDSSGNITGVWLFDDGYISAEFGKIEGIPGYAGER